MKRTTRGSREGALMLWVLGLSAALIATLVFCGDGSGPAAPGPSIPYDMATPSYGMAPSYLGDYHGSYSSAPRPYRPPSAPSSLGYRQEYQTLTNGLTTPGFDRSALRDEYQAYQGAHSAFQNNRW